MREDSLFCFQKLHICIISLTVMLMSQLYLKTTAIAVPECVMSFTENSLNEAIANEHKWVEHALPLLPKETLSNDDVIA